MITALANPARFMAVSAWATPLAALAATALLAIGLAWGLWFSPADYQQGETVRIMYVHVPSAWWSLGVYAVLAGASLAALVWGHALADAAAHEAARIGAAYAGLCLITGSFWGRPTWGTWWEWDARLTSMLLLFLTYLGYLSLRAAIDDPQRGARLGAILAIAGSVNLPIIHYSVEWWSTLHQGASVLRQGGSAIHPEMLGPLLTMSAAYGAAFVALLLAGVRAQVRERHAAAEQARQARAA
jgi:heme exporter protein C